MNIFKDFLAELFQMFIGDAWLTGAILARVLVATTHNFGTGLPPLVGGASLLFGWLAVMIGNVRGGARWRRS